MSFDWRYKDHSYAPSYRCKAYPFFAVVMDMDGDNFSWEVRKHKEVLASGTLGMEESCCHDEEDDFKLGKEKCEAIMREKIAEHIETIETSLERLRRTIAA